MKVTNKKYGKYISIATAFLTVSCGIALIALALHLFFTGGDNPYTRERVGEYLSYLVIPALLTLALIIAGKITDALSDEKTSLKSTRTEYEMIAGYAERFNLDEVDKKTRDAIIAEKNRRITVKILCCFASVLFGLTAVAYLAFIADFTVSNLSGDVLSALLIALPLAILAVGAQVPCIYICEASAKAEKNLWLKTIKDGHKPSVRPKQKDTDKGARNLIIARCVTLGLSLLLIVLGIFNGGMDDVFAKAVKICTECIGLG